MTEMMYELLLLISMAVTASVLGILMLYSHTIMPGLKRLDDATFVKSFQAIDGKIINPIFMLQFFSPLLLLGAAAFYAYQHQLNDAWYVYGALFSYFIVVGVTVAVNVPLNDGIKRRLNITSDKVFADVRREFHETKWLMFNHVRVVFACAAVIMVSAALVV